MKLLLKDNIIIGIVAFSGDKDLPEVEDDLVPSDFEPEKYIFDNNEIVVNPNYSEPSSQITVPPSDQDKLNSQFLLQLAQHKSEQDAFNAQVLLQIAQNKEAAANV